MTTTTVPAHTRMIRNVFNEPIEPRPVIPVFAPIVLIVKELDWAIRKGENDVAEEMDEALGYALLLLFTGRYC